MERAEKWDRLAEGCDVLVIGGGATGLGIAVDAATRGFRTALVEAGDFAQATSSRATKLVHGGVRYLANGQLHLVYEALRERRIMLRNAPHLVHRLGFVTPAYRWMDLPFYGAGLKAYQLLAGGSSLGATEIWSARRTQEAVPGIHAEGLLGSVLYFDGQFDDARYALALARTAEDSGATVLNYARCMALVQSHGRTSGARVRDAESGREVEVSARVIVNAGGIFLDELRQMEDPASLPLLKASRGTHLVVPGSVLGGEYALMIPKTRDGRLIFAIPWMGQCVIGTTDVPVSGVAMEPGHSREELSFLMETISPYLQTPIREAEIRSVFSGLRPLVSGNAASTAKLSREHLITASPGGLITIAGGKWTTYRRMAQDTLDFAAKGGWIERRPCRTDTVPLRGATEAPVADARLARYGTDAEAVVALERQHPEWSRALHPRLPFTAAEVVYAARAEMARTVEDVLSRRMRALLLDAEAAVACAMPVATLLAAELGRSQEWVAEQVQAFTRLAQEFYLYRGSATAG